MSISIADSHRCIERSTDCDCPICGEYMFNSPSIVVFMPQCGHSIHHKCYYEHMKTSYRCPICSRSVFNMETQFRNLDRAIESQPMPAHFQDTRALVHCNDCCSKTNVKYHWLGLKCGLCDSYNTAQIRILSGNDPDQMPGPRNVPSEDMMRSSFPSTAHQNRQFVEHGQPDLSISAHQSASPPYQLPPHATRRPPPSQLYPNPADLLRPILETDTAIDNVDDGYENINFWGGDACSDHQNEESSDIDLLEDEESENSDDNDDDFDDEDDDQDTNEYEEDEDEDDEDMMELLGHR